MTRQIIRKQLFDAHFERFLGTANYVKRRGRRSVDSIPNDLPSRKERRNLARAYAAKDWRERKAAPEASDMPPPTS